MTINICSLRMRNWNQVFEHNIIHSLGYRYT